MLEAKGITVRKGENRLLEGVSFSADAGQFWAIVGPNGAGKSTLVGTLCGREKSGGTVEWNGRPQPQWPRRDFGRMVAVMQQKETTPFAFLAREYVELGRLMQRKTSAEDGRAIVSRALAACDLTALAKRSITSLSGGERQRCQMARCLTQIWEHPSSLPGVGKALLLDEPTSALDLGQQRRILTQAWEFTRRGGLCVAVLHDLNLASAFADQVLVLLDGRVAASGRPADVLNAGNIEAWYDTAVRASGDEQGESRIFALPSPKRRWPSP